MNPQAQPHVLKHSTTTANAGQLFHGPGGMFNTPGLENPFLSTVIAPKGLGPLLPAIPTVMAHPFYGYVTEIVDGSEDEPDEVCDDAPTGILKGGTLSTVFGRVQRSTPNIDLGTITQVMNNADRTDLMLAGQLLNPENAGVGYPSNVNEQDMLNNAAKGHMVTTAFTLDRKLNKMLWSGNPADATTGKGYLPFRGLSMLVKTGYVDAETGNAVPALDSTIVDGAWGTVGPGGSYDIAHIFRRLMNYLNHLADNTVNGAQFVIVMRPEMWDAVSDVYALQYVNELVNSVDETTASVWNLDASSITDIRDQIKANHVLPVAGRQYMVVEDNGIPQLSNSDDAVNIPAGSYSSSIYILPLQIGAGVPTLYWEYLDWNVTSNLLSALGNTGGEQVFWTDGARFCWTMKRTGLCIKFKVRVEPRIILRAPQLAAVINDLLVTPEFNFRSPHSDNAGYVGGGETTRAGVTPNF